MSATPVYIICSPRPQVGKTLLARMLSELLLLKDGRVISFDINLSKPSLMDYLPNITTTAQIDDTHGKMQLMDRVILDDGIAKVIDLGLQAFDEFFQMSDEIGFIEEAAQNHVAPIVLYLADTDRASARSHRMLEQQIPRSDLIVVENEFLLHGRLPEDLRTGPVLRISELSVFLKSYIDRRSFSFTGYLRTEKDRSTELNQWTWRNYLSFCELELSVLSQRRSRRAKSPRMMISA
jgi:hypothetical protein